MKIKFLISICVALFLVASAHANEMKAETTKVVEIKNEEFAPKDWLAFVAYQGGFTTPEIYILGKTPYVMLFQDGRLIFRDEYAGPWPRRGRQLYCRVG